MTATLMALLVVLGGDWKVVKTVDGIVTKAKESPGRAIPEIEVYGDIDAEIHEVLAVMLEYPKQIRWMPKVDKLIVMKQFSETTYDEVRVYARLDSPWPVSDREVVVRNTVKVVKPGEHVEITQADERIQSPPGVNADDNVRMPKMDALFTVKKVGPRKTRVTYRVDIDPGGQLPDWLKRIVVGRMPYRTIELLRRWVKRTSGKHDVFITEWKSRYPPG